MQSQVTPVSRWQKLPRASLRRLKGKQLCLCCIAKYCSSVLLWLESEQQNNKSRKAINSQQAPMKTMLRAL